MRKIVFLFLIMSLGLAGCASGENSRSNGQGIPTDPVGSVEENTPAPGAPLDPGVVNTPGQGQPAGPMETPQAVEAPFLATFMIDSEVAGQAGRYGVVKGIVMDASAGQGQYLVVQNIGPEVQKDVLLPWGAFQLVLLAPEQAAQNQGTDEPVIWLTVEDGAVAAAPAVDASALADPDQRAEDWDAETRQYWTGKLPEMPMTGGDAAAAGGQNILYLSQGAFDRIEYKVRGANGDEVGQVEDLVINPDGSVSFGVVEFASLLDLGEQKVVVPWQRLTWSGETRAFVIDATDDQLNGAPRFDPAALPDMTVPGWDQDWQRYWEGGARQSTPAQTSAALSSQMQVSRLMGSTVTDVNEELLGEVVDIILGQNGMIDYLVIQAEDELRPVPWGDLEITSPQDSLLYLDDVQRFIDAPAFAALDQIDAAVPGWDDQIRGYWGLGGR